MPLRIFWTIRRRIYFHKARHTSQTKFALRIAFDMRLCGPPQQSSCCGADKYCPLTRIEPWFLHRPTVYSIYLFTYCCLRNLPVTKNVASNGPMADPGGRAVWGEGLWSLVCRDCWFESHRGYGCLSVVCCQVEVSTTDRSLVQRSPADCVCVTDNDHVHSTPTVSRQKNPTKKETKYAMYVWRNTDVHSRNHWCSGNAIRITYSERVSVTLGIQNVKRMRHIAICGLPNCTIFLDIISQTARFSGKGYWTLKMCFYFL
jgi:hypothetical protein